MKINVLEEVNGVFQAVTRDMTPEEEAQTLANTIDEPLPKTDAERIAELEDIISALLEGRTE